MWSNLWTGKRAFSQVILMRAPAIKKGYQLDLGVIKAANYFDIVVNTQNFDWKMNGEVTQWKSRSLWQSEG